ncbi:MAG: 23S rRNA (adenine(2503)-C(2))-methyltransferase RlmN [Bacteroidetes bacterium]|nr:MAG: 23S rRNA (adenine(2503)-C(2))-methyltransferase RlmN [Bacteroidota bacterium]
MSTTATKIDIRQFELPELEEWFKAKGQARFRAKQVYEWLWKKSAFTFEEMTNLSKDLRKELEEHFEINPITLDQVQHSRDGTIKSRFRLHDGHLMESVLIPVPEDNRFTVCVSCQVGCSLSCAFCATGLMERKRNLTAAEIYDQVVLVNKQCLETYDHPLTNIVYMGMGEPLLTYREVKKSIEMISSEAGLGMSPRRITVSTAGIAKMIKKLADDDLRVNLALSLHAADDVKRDKIMPINEHNNLEVLMESLKYFHQKTKNKISYEYIAFNDFNVTMQDARNLLKLCKHFPVRVNIIEYNSVEGLNFEKASEDRINDFAKFLRDNGVMITVRRSRGKDIDAACGQLANKDRD